MKNLKTIVVGLICAALILGYYYYLSTRDISIDNKEETEVEKVIALDLKHKYPATPREVVKVFNRILVCYYNEEYEEDDYQKLAMKQRELLDEELLANNPQQQFLVNVRADINNFRGAGKSIASYEMCSTDDVIYKVIDERECAYVTCSYFVKLEGGGFEDTIQRYVLRKDDDGNWKILVYYVIEGETAGE